MTSVENALYFGGKNDSQNLSESFGHKVKASQNISESVANTGKAGSNFYGQNGTKNVPQKMTEYSGTRNVDQKHLSQIDKSASRNGNTSNHFGHDTPKRIVSIHFAKNYADKHVSNDTDKNVDTTMCDDNDVSCLEIPCVTPGGSGTGRTSQLKSVSQVPAPYDKVICTPVIRFTVGIQILDAKNLIHLSTVVF